MNIIAELIKIGIPVMGCILIAYIIFQKMIGLEDRKEKKEIRLDAFGKFFPLKLAAYERVVLLVERINPIMVIQRVELNYPAKAVHDAILADINNEFEHNIVQQLYISELGWMAVQNAKAQSIIITKNALQKVTPNASGVELAEEIIKQVQTNTNRHIDDAIKLLRKDLTTFVLETK